MSLARSLNSIHIINSLYCLSPSYNRSKKCFQRNHMKTFVCFVLVAGFSLWSNLNKYKDKTMKTESKIMDLISNVLTTTLLLIIYVSNSRWLHCSYKKLLYILTEFDNFSAYKLGKTIKSPNTNWALILFHIFFIPFSVIDLCDWLILEQWKEYVYFINDAIHMYMISMLLLHINMLIINIQKRVELLNKFIVQDTVYVTQFKSVLRFKIQTISTLHEYLGDSIDNFNHNYGWCLMLVFAITLVNGLQWLTVLILRQYKQSTISMIIFIMWIVYNLVNP